MGKARCPWEPKFCQFVYLYIASMTDRVGSRQGAHELATSACMVHGLTLRMHASGSGTPAAASSRCMHRSWVNDSALCSGGWKGTCATNSPAQHAAQYVIAWVLTRVLRFAHWKLDRYSRTTRMEEIVRERHDCIGQDVRDNANTYRTCAIRRSSVTIAAAPRYP